MSHTTRPEPQQPLRLPGHPNRAAWRYGLVVCGGYQGADQVAERARGKMTHYPQAGIYAFNIAATGSWSLWTGKQPEVVEVPVEVEGPPAVLTEDACNAFLDGLGDGN